MGFKIHTNISALDAVRNTTQINSGLNKSLQSLSSGLRINAATDDASGLAIANQLKSQAQGLGQAIRNANDGVGVVQTADGALQEYENIINTVRTKAIQAASDGQSADTRAMIQQDIDRLLEAADDIANQTQFNGQKLLDGSFQNKAFHIGAYASETVNLSVGNVQTDAVGDITSINGTQYRAVFDSSNSSETTSGFVLAQNAFTVNGTDISASLNENSSNRFQDAKSIAAAITDATDLLATGMTLFQGGKIAGGQIDSLRSLKINGVAIANTLVVEDDTDGALTRAINDIAYQTGVRADKVNGQIRLTSEDGSNISISGTVIPQINTLTLSGTVDVGDEFTVNVNGLGDVTYIVQDADLTLDDVALGLAQAINADGATSAVVTAAPVGLGGQLTLSAVDYEAATFTVATATVNETNVVAAASQTASTAGVAAVPATPPIAGSPATYTSGTITLSGLTVLGGTYTWSDGLGNDYTFTETLLGGGNNVDAVMQAIEGQINGGGLYNASYNTTTDELTVTAVANGQQVGFLGALSSTGLSSINAANEQNDEGSDDIPGDPGVTGVAAAGTVQVNGGETAWDAGDVIKFTITDGSVSSTFSYTTVLNDTTANVITQLQSQLEADNSLYNGLGVTVSNVDVAAGTFDITANYADAATDADGKQMLFNFTGTTDRVPTDDQNIDNQITSVGANVYTVTGFSDKLTDQTSSSAIAGLAFNDTGTFTIEEGDLVINGVDMAGTYGDGSSGSARIALQSAIESIDGMEDSTIDAGGVINLVVSNGDALNIAGVKAETTFNLTKGITNESVFGTIDLFSEELVTIGGISSDAFGFEAGVYVPKSYGTSLEDVNVLTRESAEIAILIADSALKQIDATRSDLGSVQNQLVSTIRNISITQVNISSAESQIRDIDFATESARFAKLNIFAQSGSYAISQANAVQENVLRLLQ